MASLNETAEEEIIPPAIRFSVRLWIYLPVLVSSIAWSVFALYHLFHNRTLRSAPQNHIALVLLCVNLFTQLTIYPGMLHYYRVDGIWDRPFMLCVLWGYVDFTCYVIQTSLIALGSIQRHILIFHDRWMSTRFKRILFHYLPIIAVLSYCLLFHAFVFFFPPCGHVYVDRSAACALSCIWDDIVIVYYDSILHQILPVFILTLFNIVLLVRVMWKKHRAGQRFQWRKHRKVTVQFFMISSVYIIGVSPYALVSILYVLGIMSNWQDVIINIAVVVSYLPGLLLPAVCSVAIPQIRREFCRLIRYRQWTAVFPL